MSSLAQSTDAFGSRFRGLSLKLTLSCSAMTAGLLLAGESCAQEFDPSFNSRESLNGSAIDVHAFQFPTQNSERKKGSSYAKVTRYADYLFTKYDLDRDGLLQYEEWSHMHGHPERIAAQGDGSISREQLRNWISEYSRRRRSGSSADSDSTAEKLPSANAEPAKREQSTNRSEANGDSPLVTDLIDDSLKTESHNVSASESSQPITNDRRRDQKFYVSSKRLPEGLPDWFFERDKDGDGQLTLNEFCIAGGNAEQAEFHKLDANRDGVITAKECVRKGADKPIVAKSPTDGLPDQSSEKKDTRSRRKPRSTQKD